MRNLPTIEETDIELATPAASEQIAMMDANYAHTRVIAEHLFEALQSGQIDEDLFMAGLAEEIADHAINSGEIFGIDLEDIDQHIDDESGEYIEAEDNPGIGHALRTLVDHHYGDDEMGVIQGLRDIASCAGVDTDTAIDWYNDDDMPTAEQCQMMLECFPELHNDESAMQHFVSLARVSDNGEFSMLVPVVNRAVQKLNDLERREAEFSLKTDIQNGVRQIEREATELYNAGVLLPSEVRQLVAQDINPEDKADFCAYFSQAAEACGYTPQEYLMCQKFTLEFLKARGAVGGFASFSLPDQDEAVGNGFMDTYRSQYSYS